MSEIKTITLFSQDCLSCIHLCDYARAVAHNKCHYSKGNKYCPAQDLRFVVTGNLDKQAREIFKSMQDPEKIDSLSRKMQKLNKLPPDIRKEVMDRVQLLIKKS